MTPRGSRSGGWFGESYRHSLASHGFKTAEPRTHRPLTKTPVVRDKYGMDPRDKLELADVGYDYMLQHEDSDSIGAWLRQAHFVNSEEPELPTDEDIHAYADEYVYSLIDASDDSDFELALKPFDNTNQYQAARQAIVEGAAAWVKNKINSKPASWWGENYSI